MVFKDHHNLLYLFYFNYFNLGAKGFFDVFGNETDELNNSNLGKNRIAITVLLDRLKWNGKEEKKLTQGKLY
jgi:hypothetical protein